MKRLRQMKRSTRSSLFTYALVIVAFLVIQSLRIFSEGGVGSVLEGQLIPICAYVTMALALNLVVGISGELSLGHAGFMSLGAFAGSAFAQALQDSVASAPLRLALAMVFGALVAAVLGFLIGIPVLRLNGDYLAIVTLAFGEIIKSLVTNIYLGVDENGLHFSFLNDNLELADGGTELIRGPMGVMNSQRISTFVAGFVLVMVALIVIFNLVNSRTGRAIMAARDNRIAAESVGISVTKYKMIAFVVSAALAGAAGTLYGCSQTTFAATKFDFNTSILILVFVVLGGLGNMWGSVIAAAALTILPEALRQFSNYRMLVYAIVLILVMLATNNPTLKGFFSRLFQQPDFFLGQLAPLSRLQIGVERKAAGAGTGVTSRADSSSKSAASDGPALGSYAPDDENETLFQKLRELRLSIARENSLPPYMVFNDRTLRDMARLRPITDAQFLAVNGVGDSKLAKYGKRFMEAIAGFDD